MRCFHRTWQPNLRRPAFVRSARHPACRTPPMRSRSMISLPIALRGEMNGATFPETQHERDHSILRRGAHRDRLLLPRRNDVRAFPDRLRPVSGTKDPEGTQLPRLSVPARRHRCRAADACPYRPQRAVAEAGARRFSRQDPGDARHDRSVFLHAAGCRQHSGIGGRGAEPAQRRARRGPRSARSIPRPMRSPRCSRSSRSNTRPGST